MKDNYSDKPDNKKESKGKVEKLWDRITRAFAIISVILVLLALFLKLGPVEIVRVVGESMYPTFKDGEILLIDKRKTTVANIKADDIIVTAEKGIDNKCIIKRVIGIPGDTISFHLDNKGELKTCRERNGQITELDEPYLNEPMDVDEYLYDDNGNALTSKGKRYGWVCEENEYIIMGDNRNHSADSRYYGKFTTEKIKGKVVLRLFPLTTY